MKIANESKSMPDTFRWYALSLYGANCQVILLKYSPDNWDHWWSLQSFLTKPSSIMLYKLSPWGIKMLAISHEKNISFTLKEKKLVHPDIKKMLSLPKIKWFAPIFL